MTLALAALLSALAAVPDAGNPELTQAMRANLAAVLGLQPLLASPAAFKDPKNAPTIDASLATLVKMKHQFLRPRAAEPAAAIAGLFGEQVERARRDLADGRADAARMRVRGLTHLCMGCHARQLAPSDFALADEATKGLALSGLERAHFLASTRQFDAALALWADALKEAPQNDDQAFEQTQALRWALAVSVRAKDDPKATLKLLEAQSKRKGLPLMVTRSLTPWIKEASRWDKERFVASAQKPAALFQRARALIDASGARESIFPDEDSLVSLLRATAYLSEALEREPGAPWRGEALYLLGVASSAILDPDLYELDTLYLEACVRENPKTPLAVRCVERLADRVVFGFTGSGGTRLPPEVSAKLQQLRALAQ